MDRFYIGLNHPSEVWAFRRACVSVNRMKTRRKPLGCPDVLLDSGAFTEISQFGMYRSSVEDYARKVWSLDVQGTVTPTAVVSQDFMCEPYILSKTGFTVQEHQRFTVERFLGLKSHLEWLYDGTPPFHVMPVLQGFLPEDYVRCIDLYQDRLPLGSWVGVGSVCRRNGSPRELLEVLTRIKDSRPDLLLHGFGVKLTSLRNPEVRSLLHTSDSQAWTFLAKRNGSTADDSSWAHAYAEEIEKLIVLDAPRDDTSCRLEVPQAPRGGNPVP